MKVSLVGRWGKRALALVQQRNVAGGLVVALLSSMVVVAAVQADGTKATNVQLDDGSVWVSNQNLQLVGRLNVRVDELDLFSSNASTAADVLQAGRNVVFTSGAGGVQRMDVVNGQALGKNTVGFPDYQMNGGIATVFEASTGKLWVGSSASLVGADFPKKPDAILEPGSRVVLTTASDAQANSRGKVIVVRSTDWYELALDDNYLPVREPLPETTAPEGSAVTSTTTPIFTDGTVPESEPEAIKEPKVKPLTNPIDDTTQVTVVGDRLVFLKADGSLFSTDGKVAKVPGEGAVLQQAGPQNGSVLVASTAGLFEISIGSDSVKTLTEAAGPPAQPVRVGPCIYAAWSGAVPTSFKACNGAVVRPVTKIDEAVADAVLVWRVNQVNVALNSTGDGGVWADHDGKLSFVGNWQDAQAQEQSLDNTSQGQATRQADKQCVEGGSDAPHAGDDTLGMRPRQSIIDVLYNDDDPNCEPLAIAADSLSPTRESWGQLTVIDNGQHLLLSPSQELIDGAAISRQTVQFTYMVEDSSGHRSEPAQVTLAVYDSSIGNAAPALRPKADGTTRMMRTVVEEGRAVSYDVSGDWWDPDGDDLTLLSAVPEGGAATSSADGVVRFEANGVTAGPQNVAVTMSDGRLSTTEQLEVTVKPSGSPIAPVTTNDFITLVEGATGTLFPLANDSDANEDTLTLVPKWPNDSPNFRVNTVGSALEITGLVAGTYPLAYEASDNTDSTKGTVRLVVLKPDGSNHAPIAVPDKVKLRPDRVVNVDVLANDVDADGDVLAITDVRVPSGSEGGVVRATVVDRRLVQIEVVPGPDGAAPTGPFFVSYTLADGHAAERANGQDQATNDADAARSNGVIAVSIVPSTVDQPPVTAADEVWVRSGDIASIPVLVNDVDPDGDSLELVDVAQDEALQLETAGSVVSWVTGRNVFVKGGAPSTYTLQYSVSANGKPAVGRITIHVTAPPDIQSNPNNPPTPKPLVLRAVRNATVRLQVPTFGIDRDGDSVSLLDTFGGLLGAAAGNTVQVDPLNPNVILFTAGQGSGPSDQFTYSVRDTFNGVGTATVTVVVLDNDGWPPQAHDDIRRAKPGRTITVPLLANDTSPLDNPLQLAENPFFDANGLETATPQHPDAVKVLDQSKPDQHGRVEIKVPDSAGTTISEHYRITDGKNPSDAYVRVTVDPNAPNLPPVATTDIVKSSEVAQRDAVTVDVLANDFDPDDTQPLTLTLPVGQNASVVDGKVVIPLTFSAQLVLYRIADSEASTVGIIRVPGKQNHPPVLSATGKDPTTREIAADATAPITILLADIVEDPDGDPSVLLTDTEVSVVGGQGTVSRLPGNDGFTYMPPGSAEQPFQVTIQFEVTDRPQFSGEQRQDPTCNCIAPLPVVVSVVASSAPRVLSQGNVQVPQLDEEVVFDLAPLVIDDQNDPLTFVLADANAGGLEIAQSNSTLRIVSRQTGDAKIPVGTRIPVKFTVTDGNFDPVENTLWVTMIATNKGQPAAATFPEQNAERDTSVALPNLIGPATNPFPDRPLALLNPAVDGGASVTCTPTGDCQFMSTTVGTFRVTYTLKDAVDQTASGIITVLVKGKPRAPGVPRVDSVGDHVVNLTWTAADMQGGAFTTYWVTEDVTGKKMQFATTGGQFTGLTNATTYHFTVLAENEMGMGETSLASSPAVPDRVPDPPVSPVFTDYGDGTLYLAWSPPATAGDFSAIKQYQIAIGGQTLTTTGATTVTALSLQNGTDYTFKVRAQNAATTNGGWGEWSVSSAPERPSRYPDPPTNVKAVNSGDGGTPRLTVTWNAPVNNGGRPISSYKVCVVSTTNCQTITTGLQATFTANRNQSLSFNVIAYNTDTHRNNSNPSSGSTATTAVGVPDAPVISSIDNSTDRTLVVAATSTNGSGCSTFSLEYSRDGGSTWQTNSSFSGLTNGPPGYTFVARAVLPGSCGTPGTTYRSANSNPVSQTAYGPLLTPAIAANVSGRTISWSWSTSRGSDGRSNWTATLGGDCSGSVAANTSGTYGPVDFGYRSAQRTCTITVTATGASSIARSAAAATGAPPTAISTSKGLSGSGCGSGNCVYVSGTDFAPNSSLSVYCEATAGTYVGPYNLGNSDSNGSFSGQSVCWHAAGTINDQIVKVTDGTNTAQQTSHW